MGVLSPQRANPSQFFLHASSSSSQRQYKKTGKRRATEGLDSNLCPGACYLHNVTSLILLICQIIGLNHMSSKTSFNIRACSFSEYPLFRNDSSSWYLYSHSKTPSLLILWIFVPWIKFQDYQHEYVLQERPERIWVFVRSFSHTFVMLFIVYSSYYTCWGLFNFILGLYTHITAIFRSTLWVQNLFPAPSSIWNYHFKAD